jgi:hypothetical protein
MKRRASSKKKPSSLPSEAAAAEPAWAEIRRLEYLSEQPHHGEELRELEARSKWGSGRIRKAVLKPLQRGNPAAVEDAIVYLEESPRWLGSGYDKRALAASLKSAELTPDQIARLRRVVLDSIDSERVGVEFSEYARLAIKLADDRFIAEVTSRLAGAKSRPKQRLERMLRLWEAHGRK